MKPFANLRHTILIHVTKTISAISILQQGKINIGRNLPHYTDLQKQMLGEGVYLGRCYSNCVSKVRQINPNEGVSVVVSIVKLGGIYETKEKQQFLTRQILQSNGLNYNSTRCLGNALRTGTEYCIYDPKRVIPLFAWAQNPEGTFILARSDDGIYKYEGISLDKIIITMTKSNIYISEGNSAPFNSFSYEEPMIGDKVIIFPHLYDFLFGKVIQRNVNISINEQENILTERTKYCDYNYPEEEEEEAEDIENEYDNLTIKTEENKPVDVVFVIDSTSSMAPVYNRVILRVKKIIDFILDNFGLPSLYCGAVIQRNQDEEESHEQASVDEEVRRQELIQENLYFEDLEELRENQKSTHQTILYPLNRSSVIDLYPMNHESFPTFDPKISQLLRRVQFARFNVANMVESFLIDPSRRKFKYYDYIGDIDEDGNKYIISRRRMKLTYKTNEDGQPVFQSTNNSLVLYYSRTKVQTYLEMPPITYPLITELQKVTPYGRSEAAGKDWVSSLKIAMNDVSWREESWKLIVLISDKDIKEEEDKMKLLKKIEKIGNYKINVLGINVHENENDSGCLKTLIEMKDTYDMKGSGNFVIQDFNEPVENSLDCFVQSFNEMEFHTIQS